MTTHTALLFAGWLVFAGFNFYVNTKAGSNTIKKLTLTLGFTGVVMAFVILAASSIAGVVRMP